MADDESDYQRAVRYGLTKIDRWASGRDHHPQSERLMRFLQQHDLNDYNMYFDWETGGDGDNGESLMFQMDAYFEMLDRMKAESVQPLDTGE